MEQFTVKVEITELYIITIEADCEDEAEIDALDKFDDMLNHEKDEYHDDSLSNATVIAG